MAKEFGANAVTICSDSKLVVSQIKGEYQAKELIMQKYLPKVRDALLGLCKFEIRHIPSEEDIKLPFCPNSPAQRRHQITILW
jgi:ribonuclease HI